MYTSRGIETTTSWLEKYRPGVGRTARLVSELNRYFVAVPRQGTTSAEILVVEVH
jgi:hypothetical protein